LNIAERYDDIIREPRMRRLYGASGYFNTGYWTARERTLVDACDRLVDEVMSRVPLDASVIVDVGCGIGAGTRRIEDRFDRTLVAGANLSLWQLLEARRRGVTRPAAMDAARMGIRSGVADAVLSIEAAQHFDTRAAFFAEAYRVVRAGGVIATTDILFGNVDGIGAWMVPFENRITTAAEYDSALHAAGFTDVDVRDVTDITWRPFCAAMRSVFERRDAVDEFEASVSQYVIAFARKPH
jgi:cyclopropane fatty-acyl-phospholipid synthase-like methyltransferase